MNDYYTTLQVQPSATAEEVKRAYRLLALRYHPDKNPDNPVAAAMFLAVQEAYEVLSNIKRRAAYDESLWLSGRKRSRYEIINAVWLQLRAEELQQHLRKIDTYRMSFGGLRDYLLHLLRDEHLAAMHPMEAPQARHAANILLDCSRYLPVYYFTPVAERLLLLMPGDTHIARSVHNLSVEKQQRERAEKLRPWLVIFAALLLCVLMFVALKG